MAAPAYRSISNLAYGSRTNSTVPAPAGVVLNDVLVAVFTKGGSAIQPSPPVGWTLVAKAPQLSDGSLTADNWIYWKAAGAGEPGSYTWTHAAGSTEVSILAVSGADTQSPITVSPSFQAANSAADSIATAPSITTTSGSSLVIFYTQDWGVTAGALVPPADASIAWTGRLSAPTTVLQYLATGVMPAAGATGAYSHICNSNAASPRLGSLIAIQPSTIGGGAGPRLGLSLSLGLSGVGGAGGGGGVVVRVSPNNMTSNTAPAPYVASAQSILTVDYAAYNSFNSPANLYWHSGSAAPQWIKIDLGSSQAARSYTVQSRTDTVTNQPTAWTLEGSDNDSTWTVADTRTGQPTVAAGALIGTYTMTAPGTYRYWRWTFTTALTTFYVDCGNLALYS